MSTLFFTLLAILFVKLIFNAVMSPDLNTALDRIDRYVHNCDMGLDWQSMALREGFRARVLWIVSCVGFCALQFVEEWNLGQGIYDKQEVEEVELAWARNLSYFSAVVTTIEFVLSSAIVIKGTWFQCNLLAGLSKTLDCWCSDILLDVDFEAAVSSWNSLQAILKSVGRELGHCFLALQILGNVGLITALAGAFSLVLFSEQSFDSLIFQELAMLPLLLLFALAARLLGEGGALTKKCEDVPAFVNQLGSTESDPARQYLVQYILQSCPGFIVGGATLSYSVFFKLMVTLATLVSGVLGMLLRKYV